MNVKCAREHIKKIENVCKRMNDFIERHEELNDETGFMDDAIMYLADYRQVLDNAIEEAELKI